MFVYIITVAAAFLSFMALLSSFRFLFSRQGIYWFIPILISAILLYQNLVLLLSTGEVEDAVVTISILLPAFLSLFWYSFIIIFHYALKLAIPENKYINNSRKNLKESQYLEKYENRKSYELRLKRKNKAHAENSIPQIPEYKTNFPE